MAVEQLTVDPLDASLARWEDRRGGSTRGGGMKARSWVAVAAGLVALAVPASASAAVTIGEDTSTSSGEGFLGCSLNSTEPCTFVQLQHPSRSFVSPIDGVIVRWRVRGNTTGAEFALRVLRRNADGTFTGRSTSTPTPIVAGSENSTPTGLPIQQGEYIGLDFVGLSGVEVRSVASTQYGFWRPRLGDGESRAPVIGGMELAILYNADVEPDADCDGFGDETQDPFVDPTGCNPPQPEPGDSTAPVTTITGGPKDKTKKKTATFTFTGTDVRAIASFQCKLDTGAFAPCTSPHTVKVKKGKHTFQVEAIDGAGNVGAPATDTWKRKKKRKR
jgi:hypothetical protein